MEELLKILEDEKYNRATKATKELAAKCYKKVEPHCDRVSFEPGTDYGFEDGISISVYTVIEDSYYHYYTYDANCDVVYDDENGKEYFISSYDSHEEEMYGECDASYFETFDDFIDYYVVNLEELLEAWHGDDDCDYDED